MPMIFLISPVTDNIKHEKDSRWMYFVSTLPSGRKAYVNSYFTFYTVLTLIGLVIGLIIVSIITQNINLAVMSSTCRYRGWNIRNYVSINLQIWS